MYDFPPGTSLVTSEGSQTPCFNASVCFLFLTCSHPPTAAQGGLQPGQQLCPGVSPAQVASPSPILRPSLTPAVWWPVCLLEQPRAVHRSTGWATCLPPVCSVCWLPFHPSPTIQRGTSPRPVLSCIRPALAAPMTFHCSYGDDKIVTSLSTSCMA